MMVITIDVMEKFFLCMTLINFGLMIFSFLFFVFGKEFIYRVHGTWFKMPREKFDSSLYKTFAFYKICIVVFNLVPYIAVRIIA